MSWEAVSAPPALAPGEVHVWRVGLDASPECVGAWRQTRTDDERARADRFRLEPLRRRYTAGRGRLRALLSRYVGLPPAEVALDSGPHGKPALANPATGIEFNLSHSGEVALIALSRRRAVGVDVEGTERQVAWDQVASRFFSPRERQALGALPEGQRRTAFFRCWTRKEAYVKATGQGLALGLTRFAVTLAPQEPPAVAWVEGGRGEDWGLADVDPGPGCVGAVCAAGRDWSLRLLQD